MEEPQTDVLKEMTDMIYAARNYHNYRKAQQLEDLQDLEALDALEDELELEDELQMETREEPERRKPGGQPGNQNARKHGFYSQLFPAEELDSFDKSRTLKDCADDIAALRHLIGNLIRRPRRNMQLINESYRELARMLAVQRHYLS